MDHLIPDGGAGGEELVEPDGAEIGEENAEFHDELAKFAKGVKRRARIKLVFHLGAPCLLHLPDH